MSQYYNPTSLSAIEMATRAIEADNKGELEKALDLYGLAIEKLLESLKNEPSHSRKQIFSNKAKEYIERAEYIKTVIENKKAIESNANPSGIFRRVSNLIFGNTTLHNVSTMEDRDKDSLQNDDSTISQEAVVAVTADSQLASTRTALGKQYSKYALMILDEVLDKSPGVKWEDISGLELAKQVLQEAVILPSLRPDIFVGLRAPPRGVLLFGPPGTGKTLLAKAVATESNATFFSISASSLTSKWVGEGEKLVRSLFAMALELQPSVVFIDEIDSLLSARTANENDASRRIKNQFFVELDGAASNQEERILVIGATNRPQELDDAIIRRLEKRVYVALPSASARKNLIVRLLGSVRFSKKEMDKVVLSTEGYSGSDLHALCKEAALGPVRELGSRIRDIKSEDVRPIIAADFFEAMKRIRKSVSPESLQQYERWDENYGSHA